MKRSFAVAMLLSVVWSSHAFDEPPRFKKASDHCYYLLLESARKNVAAVITDDGVLLVDPPAGPDLSLTAEALKSVTPKAVRWVVFSSPRTADPETARFFAEQGALLLAGARQRSFSVSEKSKEQMGLPAGSAGDLSSFPLLMFERGIQLHPSNLEIRITALQHKAHTGADVFLYVPAEKVLFVGDLYEAGSYPDIDVAMGGSAGEWANGLKQVVDSVPVLKPAITRNKPDPKEPEKTLEEGVTVISARGEVSNLQNMKDLLGAVQKLRADMSRSMKTGRTCESYLDATRAAPYRVYGNFEGYAGQLCEEIRDSKFELRE